MNTSHYRVIKNCAILTQLCVYFNTIKQQGFPHTFYHLLLRGQRWFCRHSTIDVFSVHDPRHLPYSANGGQHVEPSIPGRLMGSGMSKYTGCCRVSSELRFECGVGKPRLRSSRFVPRFYPALFCACKPLAWFLNSVSRNRFVLNTRLSQAGC